MDMFQSLPDPQSAAHWCRQQLARNKQIGYVPTMGALHRGHLSLVECAVQDNDVACVSIFVNPLQFTQPDDLQEYPRTMQRDIALLQQVGCKMVYSGTLPQFFPEVADVNAMLARARRGDLPSHSSVAMHGLEGEFRPGHLQGVWAIVERLFDTVGPCNAYFGEKDFQQTLVVKDLAKRFPHIKVVVRPTVREPSGLAMSSRNSHLSTAQLRVAAKLYQALLAAKRAWHDGVRNADEIEWLMRSKLQDARIRVEYAVVRDTANWSALPPNDTDGTTWEQARALVAAYVGTVRLIDNIALN